MGNATLYDFKSALANVKARDDEERQRQRKAARQRHIEASARMAAIPPEYIGSDFGRIKTPNALQAQAINHCRLYAERFAEMLADGSNLILWGPNGTGKTMLACAIVAEVISQGFTGLFCVQGDMMSRLRSCYRRDATQREEDVIESFRSPDLLVIDEIGESFGSPETRNRQLFDIINDRSNNRRPIIATSNKPPEVLSRMLGSKLWERLATHSRGVSIVKVDGINWRQLGVDLTAPLPAVSMIRPQPQKVVTNGPGPRQERSA